MSVPDSASGDVELIARTPVRGLRWALVIIVLVLLFGSQLPKLLKYWDVYRPVEGQLTAFAVFTVVPLWVAVSMLRGRSMGRSRWVLLFFAFSASFFATVTVPPAQRLGIPHWSEGMAGAPITLLVLGCGVGLLTGLLLLNFSMVMTVVLLGGQSAVTFAGLVNETVVIVGFQLSAGLVVTLLSNIAVSAARIAREEEQIRTADAVANQLHADRKDRYAALADTTAPLLAGLSSGELNPGDESVQRCCAVEAGRMRRLFGDGADVADPLVHELWACIDLAERKGIAVRFSERGERPHVPKSVRRTLTEPAVAALATAASSARVTVVGTGESITVSVVADSPPNSVPSVLTDGVSLSTVVTGGQVWVETTWRAPA
jgi:hypothetical protein